MEFEYIRVLGDDFDFDNYPRSIQIEYIPDPGTDREQVGLEYNVGVGESLNVLIQPGQITEGIVVNGDETVNHKGTAVLTKNDAELPFDLVASSGEKLFGDDLVSIIEYDNQGKKIRKKIPDPVIFNLNKDQLMEYAEIYKFLFFKGQRSKYTSWEYCRVIEMVVANNFKKMNKLSFTLELPLILKSLWLMYETGHPLVIFVKSGDDGSYYTHNMNFGGSRVPYKKVSESDVLKFIKDWIQFLFNGNPPSNLSDYEFAQKVLRNLQLDITLKKIELTSKMPPGVAFSAGYVFKLDGKNLLSFMEYSKETFVDECLNTNPPPIILENDSRPLYRKALMESNEKGLLTSGSGANEDIEETMKIFKDVNDEGRNAVTEIDRYLQDPAFQLLLRVITEDDPMKAVVVRSLINRVINAPKEGRRYNQAFWLYGAPGTSKSFIVNILKAFAQGSYVELSRSQNQFTAISFMNTKLIIVSDISKLSSEMVEMLRKILGRDTLYAEDKHKSGYHVVEPFAQVVFTSNDGPECFPEIFQKPGLKDKVTAIRFNSSIPEDLMISDMTPIITRFANHLFTWGMLTPQVFLDQQVRGKTIQNYLLRGEKVSQSYYNEYIEERLVMANPGTQDIYVTKSELKNDFENWLAENSLADEVLTPRISQRFIVSNLKNALQLDYGLDIRELRLRKGNQRPYAIMGCGLSSQYKGDENVRPIKREVMTFFDFHGFDPYYKVDCLKNAVFDDRSFQNISEQIIKHRQLRGVTGRSSVEQ